MLHTKSLHVIKILRMFELKYDYIQNQLKNKNKVIIPLVSVNNYRGKEKVKSKNIK